MGGGGKEGNGWWHSFTRKTASLKPMDSVFPIQRFKSYHFDGFLFGEILVLWASQQKRKTEDHLIWFCFEHPLCFGSGVCVQETWGKGQSYHNQTDSKMRSRQGGG